MSSDPKYDAWHSVLAAHETPNVDERLDATWHRLLLPRLGALRGLQVAEIGCGRGDLSIYLARRGAQVTALDVSAAAVEIGRQRSRQAGVSVRWQQGDAQDTGLPANAFDCVVSCECLEHVERPERMAAELFRITAPGGRCLVTTPSYLNGMLIAWGYSLLTRRPLNTGAGVQPRENFFVYPLVRRMLRRTGFEVARSEGRLLPLLLLPGVNPARLRIERLPSAWAQRLATPFCLHLLYELAKPQPGPNPTGPVAAAPSAPGGAGR